MFSSPSYLIPPLHSIPALLLNFFQRTHNKRSKQDLNPPQAYISLIGHHGRPLIQRSKENIVQTLHIFISPDQSEPALIFPGLEVSNLVDKSRFAAIED